MTDVSLVIVNWNTKDLLLDCIGSTLDTTRVRKLEITVVDNGSTDGSAEAVKRSFPNVTVIRNQANLGFARANNIGIRPSRGKYLCLVNSDIKVLPGCIDSMCDYMDQHPEIGLLGPKILNKDLSLQPSCAELPSLWNTFTQTFMLDRLFPGVRFCRTRFMRAFAHDVERDVEALSGCFLMVKREALEQVGLLDERFFIYQEDVDWCKRFSDAGWKIRFCPSAEAIHYGGASSSVAPAKFLIEMQRASLQYWRKHHGWLSWKTATAIAFLHYLLRICLLGTLQVLKSDDRGSRKRKLKDYAACFRWLGGVLIGAVKPSLPGSTTSSLTPPWSRSDAAGQQMSATPDGQPG